MIMLSVTGEHLTMLLRKRHRKLFIGIIFSLVLPYGCFPSAGQSRDIPVDKLLQNLKTGQYSGKPIDLDLENVDLKTVFSRLGEVSGIPFELSPDFQTDPVMSWTYRCKGVPWDQVLALVIQEFGFEAVPKGDDVYLQPKTGGRMKLVREDRFKKPGPSRTVPLLIIIGALAAAGGAAGSLLFKRAAKTKAGTSKEFSLDPERAEEMRKRLVYLFEVEKIFKNDDLTLRSLAEDLSVPPHQLSWVLNKKMSVTFSGLLNSYRIEEVKKRLASAADAEKTILDIAFDAGFRTKTSFNRTFFRLTGKTPSQYRKDYSSPKTS
jgi:AraC-like DNA-binding protein